MKKLMILLSVLVMSACGGSSSDGDDNNVGKLAGVWDFTTDEGVEGVDEFYMVIDSEGYISYYDYAGDSYDNYANCYWVDEDIAQLKSLGENRYEWVFFGDSDYSFESIMIRSGNKLTLKETDSSDEFVVYSASQQVSDFTPNCDDVNVMKPHSAKPTPKKSKKLF